jgi:outer membrane cobalamin receptor
MRRRAALIAPIVLALASFAGSAATGAEEAPAAADPGRNAGDEHAKREGDEIDEIVVKGLRMGRFLGSPSSFESTIEVDDYRGERQRLEDLLAQQVGLQLRRFGGPGDPAEISIRGSTANQVAVLLDDVPLGGAVPGGADVSKLCLGLVESVQISRGGGSVETGGGAIGGVVQLRTRRPGTEPEGRVSISGGAWNTWEGSAFLSARAGALEYGLGYCGFTTEGNFRFARPILEGPTRSPYLPPVIERINNESVRHSATLSLGGDTGSVGHLRFSDYFTYGERGAPGFDSENGVTGGQNAFARSETLHNLAKLEWSALGLGVFGDELSLAFYHRYAQEEFRDITLIELGRKPELATRASTPGLLLRDAWSGHWLFTDHRLEVRAEVRRESFFGEEDDDHGRTTASVMASDDLGWLGDRILLVPALRYEWSQDFGSEWLPGLGVVLAPVSWLRLKANVQRSYRLPDFDELYLPDKGFIRGNPDLVPELALNADAGLELIADRLGPIRDLVFSGGLFLQEIDESIVWMPISPFTVAPQNTGPARVRGYELALRFGVTRYLRLSANHTGLDSESLTTGRPLVGRADNETNFRVEVGPAQVWKLVAELQRTGEIPVSASGQRRLPARSVWNTSASLNLAQLPGLRLDRWTNDLWLFATLTNVGDVAVRDVLSFPRPGRSGYLGMEMQWR